MAMRFLPVPATPAVKAEQIRLLYRQGAAIQLLGILTAIVVVVMFWRVVNHTLLGLWFTILLTVSLIRLFFTFRFTSSNRDVDHTLKKWGVGYAFGALVSGLIWGSLSLFFDPSWPPIYLIMLFAIYTGISAGAFNTHSSYFPAFQAFYLPQVACITYIALKQAESGYFELTILFMIYVVLMYFSSLNFHNRLVQWLEISFEYERVAEQLAESNRKLTHLADTDALTGIYNRRSLDRSLTREWNRHYRIHKPISLLFMDIDFFKQYNDSYGHDGGDQCLILIAKVLREHAQRSNDIVARFGGEEFAVILPETGEAYALKIAEAIRSGLENLHIPHPTSSIANYVTISIGVVTMTPNHPDDYNPLYIAADKALYQAKKTGRNRVCVADIKNLQPA